MGCYFYKAKLKLDVYVPCECLLNMSVSVYISVCYISLVTMQAVLLRFKFIAA